MLRISEPGARSVPVALLMALSLGVSLLGWPAWDGSGPTADEALRRSDALIARGEYEAALALVHEAARVHTDDFLLDRQFARVYEGLGRPLDEAAAWERFLRRSVAPGDACRRIAVLARDGSARENLAHGAMRCHTPGIGEPR